MTSAISGVQAYGGFAVGGMQLALPLAALREVRSVEALTPLPCRVPGVIGGLSLCDVVLPVLDLRILIGRPCGQAGAVIVVVAHQGVVLGLLADSVTGVFSSDAKGLNPAHVDDAVGRMLAGSVRRSDDGQLAAVLSAAALITLPGVPVVDDPEPGRQQLADPAALLATTDADLPVMLLRCGQLTLAVDAMAVHTTVSGPSIERSALAIGDCLGVIDYGGAKLPAIDLASLCGLGRSVSEQLKQAFLLQLDAGMVALMIGEVIDVVRTRPGDVIAVPAFALPRADLFAGTLPTAALPPQTVARARELGAQYLVIDGQSLKRLPELQALAAVSRSADSAVAAGDPASATQQAQAAAARPMITFELGGEAATPLAQVVEILPYSSATAVLAHGQSLLGIVTHRGRAIPVMCLSGLVGLPAPRVTAALSVLVVDSGGELMGFAVPQLRTIELADWEPELPTDPAHRHDALGQSLHARTLALVGEGDAKRMLRVFDLQRLAVALQRQASAVH